MERARRGERRAKSVYAWAEGKHGGCVCKTRLECADDVIES